MYNVWCHTWLRIQDVYCYEYSCVIRALSLSSFFYMTYFDVYIHAYTYIYLYKYQNDGSYDHHAIIHD